MDKQHFCKRERVGQWGKFPHKVFLIITPVCYDIIEHVYLRNMKQLYIHSKTSNGTSKLLLTSVMPPRYLIDRNIIIFLAQHLMTVHPNDCTKLPALGQQSALALNPIIAL